MNKKKQNDKDKHVKSYDHWRWNILVRRNIPWYFSISAKQTNTQHRFLASSQWRV
jgi:hypothetical protein